MVVWTRTFKKTRTHIGSSLNSVIYDAWQQCGEGDWSKSKFLMSIREKTTHRKRGHRAWLFAWQMDEKFGAELGQQLRDSKLLDEAVCAKEVRYYPGLKPSEQSRQFLTLVDDSEEHIEEEEIDRLFKAADASSSSSSSSSSPKKGKKTAKGKKEKEKKTKKAMVIALAQSFE